jgi:hypothetical protein
VPFAAVTGAVIVPDPPATAAGFFRLAPAAADAVRDRVGPLAAVAASDRAEALAAAGSDRAEPFAAVAGSVRGKPFAASIFACRAALRATVFRAVAVLDAVGISFPEMCPRPARIGARNCPV